METIQPDSWETVSSKIPCLVSLSGYGVFAERQFVKGDFLFQYPGLLKNSEDVEEQDQTYIFHFKENGRNLW